MQDIEKLEKIMKLMQKYGVRAVKVGGIEIAGISMPEEHVEPKTEEVDEDLLFYSAEG
jgi:predicted dinucleotide-binding enzyme